MNAAQAMLELIKGNRVRLSVWPLHEYIAIMDGRITAFPGGKEFDPKVSVESAVSWEFFHEPIKPSGQMLMFNAAEIQSGYDRVQHAEGLILQLPKDHDGRNTWLMNYGTGLEAKQKRKDWCGTKEIPDPINDWITLNPSAAHWTGKVLTTYSPPKPFVLLNEEEFHGRN